MKHFYLFILVFISFKALAQIPTPKQTGFEQVIERYLNFNAGGDPQWVKLMEINRDVNPDFKDSLNRKSPDNADLYFMNTDYFELSNLEIGVIKQAYFPEIRSVLYEIGTTDIAEEVQYKNIYKNDTLYSYGGDVDYEEEPLYYDFLGTYYIDPNAEKNANRGAWYNYKGRDSESETTMPVYQNGYFKKEGNIQWQVEKTDTWFGIYIDTLDANGLIKNSVSYSAADSASIDNYSSITRYEYDQQNRITKKTWYSDEIPEATGEPLQLEVSEIVEFSYDATNKTKKTYRYNTVFYEDLGFIMVLNDSSKTVIETNNGKIIRKEIHGIYNGAFKLYSKYDYTYDQRGNLVRSDEEVYSEQDDEYTITFTEFTDTTKVQKANYLGDLYVLDSTVFAKGGIITNQANFNFANETKINWSPNPSTEQFRISGSKEIALVKIINTQGELVLQQSVAENSPISTQELISGLYIIQVYNNKEQLLQQGKLIIQ